MTNETQIVAETNPALAQEGTASPAVISEKVPEIGSDVENQDQGASKTFTQDEVDAIIGKRLAKEHRKWERQLQVEAEAAKSHVTDDRTLSLDQFASPEAYAEALAEQKAAKLVAERNEKSRRTEVLDTFHEREEDARTKYDDFDQIVYNDKLPITETMALTIQESDIGPDLAYWLGSNPKEAARIAKLSPFLQAKEIGRIEAKIADSPPLKKTTSAPAPITPVKSKTAGTPSYDTTDPRSVETMSTSEWIAAERRRQVKKFAAQGIT